MDNQSSNDQNNGSGLNKSALIPAVILLILPAAVPLFFLGQADGSTNKMVLVGTTVCVALLNVVLIVALVRWFKRMKQD